MATPTIQVLNKALSLLRRLSVEAPTGFGALTEGLGLPRSTSHRIIATLEQQGFLLRAGRDQYFGGHLLSSYRRAPLPASLVAAVAKPFMVDLARRSGLTAQLGILEDGMVTYIFKAGRQSLSLFTREGLQLEAYCSAIGKVLLAALPAEQLERYLADGPFVSITPNTITNPRALRSELDRVRKLNHAQDQEEIQPGLFCMAVPLNGPQGTVAALSISGNNNHLLGSDRILQLDRLRATAITLQHKLFQGATGLLAPQ